jgi:glycosyltransferase involved in cell wall biosynthesis
MDATILIPAFNALAFIGDAIQSALRQTGVAIEVLVVDDGSTDATADRAAAFGDPVRVLRVPHAGLPATRNAGMEAARGRFVVLLDADDILEPGLVARAVDLHCRQPGLAFVFFNHRYLLPDGRVTSPHVPARAFGGAREAVLDDPLRQVLLAGYFISSTGFCASRDALREAGTFDTSLWGAEDFEYFSRLYLRRPAGYVAEPLVLLRRHGANMTNQAGRMVPSMILAVEKVTQRCEAAGRSDLATAARRYAGRSIAGAIQGVISGGNRQEGLRLLRRHRRLLTSPRWCLLVLAALLPASWFARLRALKHRLDGRWR